jgi:hypothetical protein
MTTTLLSDRIHHFGTLTLDERMGTLSRGDEQLFLRPKTHALMLHLARSICRLDIRVPGWPQNDPSWPRLLSRRRQATRHRYDV